MINYQGLLIQENRVTLSWIVIDTCTDSVEVEGYVLSSGVPTASEGRVSDTVARRQTSVIIEPRNQSISYKLVARDTAGNVCSSTQDLIYYGFGGEYKIAYN